MRKTLVLVVLSISALAALFLYFRWSSAIRQPLKFSHSDHVRRGLNCSSCHDSANLDSLPTAGVCLSCHAEMTLPAQVRWIKIYRVAPDIIFSHTQHRQDDCSACHRMLVDGKRWIHESRFTMDFCMQCHEKRRADNTCGACHKNR